ncbi:MAG TPA: hypothetical protein VFU72_13775 [Nitrolancea sp.]|nr:hypothetical protein [Nitrolancea sp.]
MAEPGWTLTGDERRTLALALDALLPPGEEGEGSFPWPSQTGLIDEFILRRVPPAGVARVPYPGLDSDGLRRALRPLAPAGDLPGMTAALARLEAEDQDSFTGLWRLAVYGYYSRPETIAAIQRELAPAYHGAPLPLGYAHAIEPWNPDDPLQHPRHPRGHYVPTEAVRRVDVDSLSFEEGRR